MPVLVLASRSPYRAVLLRRLGIPFTQADPAVDEGPFKTRLADPRELTSRLAEAKAAAAAGGRPDAVVIGCDQVAHLDGEVMGKPGDADGAREQLRRLAGRTHELVTALAVRSGDRARRHLDVTRLTMRDLDGAAIDRYLERDEPFDCAGAYKLEAAGIALFARIETADHSAIVGLPLIALADILLEFGFAIP